MTCALKRWWTTSRSPARPFTLLLMRAEGFPPRAAWRSTFSTGEAPGEQEVQAVLGLSVARFGAEPDDAPQLAGPQDAAVADGVGEVHATGSPSRARCSWLLTTSGPNPSRSLSRMVPAD